MAGSDTNRHDRDAGSIRSRRELIGVWGIRPGLRVWVGGHNVDARRVIEAYLTDAARPPVGEIELGLVAPLSIVEALYFAGKLRSRLAPKGSVWIVYTDTPPPPQNEGPVDPRTLRARMLEQGYAEIGNLKLDNTLHTSGFEPSPRTTTSVPSTLD